MTKSPKRGTPLAQKRPAGDTGPAKQDAARPARGTGGWAAAIKPPDKKFEARRKLPSGPLGGSGRKTNASRSS